MPVKAIQSQYQFEPLDLQKHYGDQLLIYVGWDHHTLYCAAHAMLVSPQQSFAELIQTQIQAGFHQHPEFEKIQWDQTIFQLNGEALAVDMNQTLEQLGFDHKSLLRFKTPELTGYKNAHV